LNRSNWLVGLLVKAAWVHKGRALTALLSVGVMASLVTVTLTIRFGVEDKLNREFRSFGSNVIMTAHDAGFASGQLDQVRKILGDRGQVVPVAYVVARTASGTRVVLGGSDLQALKNLNPWWLSRPIPTANGGAIVGSNAARMISHDHEAFELVFGDKKILVRPGTVIQSSSDDDNRIYVDLSAFISFTGVNPTTAYLRIDGTPEEIQSQIKQLSATWPDVDFKPVRQITAAQTAVLSKIRSVVLYIAAVVIVLIIMCMAATQSSSVLERRIDFALMKALGASNTRVNLLFAGEAALISLAGGIIGFTIGGGLTCWIGKVNFAVALVPPPIVLGPVLLSSVAVALISSTTPLRLLTRVHPALVLKGE
jgi:putative ABC transport system permease protein